MERGFPFRLRAPIGILSTLIALLSGSRAAGFEFTLETADGSAHDVGRYAALALDSDDNPHITYRDATTGDLMYARREGGVWTIEAADTSGDAGWHTSLALDASGGVHVSYGVGFNGQSGLRYAHRSGGTWALENLAGAQVGGRTSIALDGAGDPRVFYTIASCGPFDCDFTPYYASKTGTEWSYQAIENFGGLFEGSVSLRIDSQDVPHFAYLMTNVLMYKKDAVMFPSGEGLPGSQGNGSLALDSQDAPHVAFQGGGKLGYSRRSGGNWSFQTIQTGNVGYWPSIAVDAAGDAHVSYEDATNHDLRYARTIDGTWVATAADASPNNTGQFTSIAIDSQGRPHIAYYDDTTDDLLYTVVTGEPTGVPLASDPAVALRVATNPARIGEMRFVISAPSAAEAALSVFDPSGRLVAALPPVRGTSSESSIGWDGRDSGGRQVAPGTYLARLEAAGVRRSARFTLVR